MSKAGKKYTDAAKLIEAGKAYSPKEAVELVKQTSVTKFDSTVEVSVRLGVDPKYADQQVRGALVLPTVPANPRPCWYSPEALRPKKPKLPAQTLLALMNTWKRSKAAGPTSTSA